MKQEQEHEKSEKETPVTEETAEATVEQKPEETEDQELTQENNPAEAEIERLHAELQDLQNRYLRVQADFDNFRKRSRQEKEELSQYATMRLIQELLPVIDNFQLAMNAQTDDVDTLKKGIDMVWRQLQQILEKEGLFRMETVGQPFDPNVHEAVMQVEATEEFPSGTIVEELRSGYKLKEKVIRAAMVKVAQ
jgi:molecular chaperone GrpE